MNWSASEQMTNDLHVQSEQGLQIKFDFWISAEKSKNPEY